MRGHIAQQSVIRVGSLCIIFGEENDINNGRVVVADTIFFEEGEWWVSVSPYDIGHGDLMIVEEGKIIGLDRVNICARILTVIGDVEMEIIDEN